MLPGKALIKSVTIFYCLTTMGVIKLTHWGRKKHISETNVYSKSQRN
jgi:hypothetical protein